MIQKEVKNSRRVKHRATLQKCNHDLYEGKNNPNVNSTAETHERTKAERINSSYLNYIVINSTKKKKTKPHSPASLPYWDQAAL